MDEAAQVSVQVEMNEVELTSNPGAPDVEAADEDSRTGPAASRAATVPAGTSTSKGDQVDAVQRLRLKADKLGLLDAASNQRRSRPRWPLCWACCTKILPKCAERCRDFCFAPAEHGVDFTFDQNRSNALTVLYVTSALFVFFAYVITGANSMIQDTAECLFGTKHVTPLVLYVFSMLFTWYFGIIAKVNEPRGETEGCVVRTDKTLGSFLVMVAFAVYGSLIAVNATPDTRVECTQHMQPVTHVARACPWVFNASQQNLANEEQQCRLAGGKPRWIRNGMYLGVINLAIPKAITWGLMLLLCVAFFRVACTKQNMFIKRRLINLRHTEQLLGVGTGTERQRRLSALQLPRGALHIEVTRLLAPLFDAEGSGACGGGAVEPGCGLGRRGGALIHAVAASVVAQIEQAALSEEENAAKASQIEVWSGLEPPPPSPEEEHDSVPILAPNSPAGRAQKTRGARTNKKKKKKTLKSVDALSYLPSTLQIAVLSSVLLLLLVFDSSLYVSGSLQAFEEDSAQLLQNATQALGSLQSQLQEAESACNKMGSANGASRYASLAALQESYSSTSGVVQGTYAAAPVNAFALRSNLSKAQNSLQVGGLALANLSHTNETDELLSSIAELCAKVDSLQSYNTTFTKLMQTVQRATSLLRKSEHSTNTAFIAANSIAFVVALVLSARALFRFRDVQQMVRRGKGHEMGADRPFVPAQYRVASANKFIGLQIGSVLFGYAVIVLILWPILALAFNRHFWAWVWANGYIPVSLVITVFQLYFLDRIVGNRWLSNGYWIRNPGGWTLFSTVVMMSSVVTGLAASVKRFVFLIAFALGSVLRLDSTRFPSRLVSYDKGYSSFMSVIMLRHRHCSPVISVARELRFGLGKRGLAPSDNDTEPHTASKSEAQKRARTRWHLAYTLLNNPQLIYGRQQAADPEQHAGGAGDEGSDFLPDREFLENAAMS